MLCFLAVTATQQNAIYRSLPAANAATALRADDVNGRQPGGAEQREAP